MPTFLSVPSLPFRKKYKLTLLLLVAPLFFYAQTLTGLWTGALHNDSTTVRKDQSFEIALTEYKGKVYGYSRSEFIVDDTLYYVVKRVKGTIDGDVCEVVDDEIVAYNFRGRLDKGIKVTSTFRRNQQDSTWYLDGTWKTNATKKYYSVTGKVNLAEEKDLTASKLFPHLEELNLADQVAFYKERIEKPVATRLIQPQRIRTEYASVIITPPSGSDLTVNKPNWQPIDAAREATQAAVAATIIEDPSRDKITGLEVARTETKNIPSASTNITVSQPSTPVFQTTPVSKTDVAGTTSAQTSSPPIKTPVVSSPATNEEQKQAVVKNTTKENTNRVTPANKPVTTPATPGNNSVISKRNENTPAIRKEQSAAVATTNNMGNKNTAPVNAGSKPASTPPVPAENKTNTIAAESKPVDPATSPAFATTPAKTDTPAIPTSELIRKGGEIAGRKSVFAQEVDFKSDSLELSLYDNGEIDGDTVSVYLNGEVIMARQGLKASAIKKTIYITPGNEDFTLVLFAENLGRYPPNTGLLVVHDGNDVYNLRFSSDFQKNSGIIFRRKK